jgi:hypothetical protein
MVKRALTSALAARTYHSQNREAVRRLLTHVLMV